MSLRVVLKRMQCDIRAARTLGADAASRRTLTRDFMSYPFLKATGTLRESAERTVKIQNDITLTYRAERGDIWAVRQMWVDEVCRLPVNLSPTVIVDLGANIGMAGVYLAKRYGCKRLIGVEPVPANAKLAARNYAQNGINASVFEGAVGDIEGTARFLTSTGSGNGRVDFQCRAEKNAATTVPITTMDTLLRDVPTTGAVLMKMDIEGAEQQVLQNRPDWLQRVSALLLEFHPPLANEKQLTEIVLQSGLQRFDANSALTAFFLRDAQRTRMADP